MEPVTLCGIIQDRHRSIRQCLIVQRMHSAFAACALEEMMRCSIATLYELCDGVHLNADL